MWPMMAAILSICNAYVYAYHREITPYLKARGHDINVILCSSHPYVYIHMVLNKRAHLMYNTVVRTVHYAVYVHAIVPCRPIGWSALRILSVCTSTMSGS